MKPNVIKLVGVCPHCGEAVEFVLTKKEVKEIWKGFKLDYREANKRIEAKVLKRNEEVEK